MERNLAACPPDSRPTVFVPGLLLAATLLAIGLPLMVADAVRLKLWDAGQGDIPVIIFGVLIALVGLGLACLAVYGVVRAIGWVIGGLAA